MGAGGERVARAKFEIRPSRQEAKDSGERRAGVTESEAQRVLRFKSRRRKRERERKEIA